MFCIWTAGKPAPNLSEKGYSMKRLPWILLLLLGCTSCGQKSVSSETKAPEAIKEAKVIGQSNFPESEAFSGTAAASNSPSKSTAMEPTPSAINGNPDLNILATTNSGKIVSAKAIDKSGALKWTENYSYDGDSKRLIEMRRTKSDGTTIQVLYKYSSDGTPTRIVIAPDGRIVPVDEQDAVLSQ